MSARSEEGTGVPQATCLRKAFPSNLPIVFEGAGDGLAKQVYIPLLSNSARYDRETGYFDTSSFVVVAAGLARLIRNGGRMRLLMGVHNLSPEIESAQELSRERAERLLTEVGRKIAEGLLSFQDFLSRSRLQALAWMLASKTLDIKVAVPKRTFHGRADGIFHGKMMIMRDADGCAVSAVGSSNETRPAYDVNGENLTLHMSWRPGADEYIAAHQAIFETLWRDGHPDYYVFDLPQAIVDGLGERFYTKEAPVTDPVEIPRRPDDTLLSRLRPAAEIVRALGNHPRLWHLSLGPVRLYPHQVFTTDMATRRAPVRVLLADEVGLGKTLEAGAIVKSLIRRGDARRVLILAPKNVVRQWQDELRIHFGLEFRRLETGLTRRLVGIDGIGEPLGRGQNPFDMKDCDFLVASWHYARGTSRRASGLLESKRRFDLIVIDEAHAARRTAGTSGRRATRLFRLASQLSLVTRHLVLVTATPIQLDLQEAHDLLRILGLGGPWARPEAFEEHYSLLGRKPEEISLDEWNRAFERCGWVVANLLPDEALAALLAKTLGTETEREAAKRMFNERAKASDERRTVYAARGRFQELLARLGPMQWLMIRNTRERLQGLGFVFPERVVKEISVVAGQVVASLLRDLDTYVTREYGRFETMLNPEQASRTGFVRVIYHQRFASSLHAARTTLQRRADFLHGLLEGDKGAVERYANWMADEAEAEEDIDMAIADAQQAVAEDPLIRTTIEEELGLVNSLVARIPDDPKSAPDPKLELTARLIEEFAADQGRRVIVFTRYTDTLDSLVEHLRLRGTKLPWNVFGMYTGGGGRRFKDGPQTLYEVEKDDIVDSLEAGELKVLLGSDAAAEGLNLQAADAVINIDVPWNPARLEQRIGRADRLGQQSAVVDVRNLWYPDSIERRMYEVLQTRHDLYRLAVGPAQSIFSEALQKAHDQVSRGISAETLVKQTVRALTEILESHSPAFKAGVGLSWEGGKTLDDAVMSFLEEFCVLAAAALGYRPVVEGGRLRVEDGLRSVPSGLSGQMPWLSAGHEGALSLAHPLVWSLSSQILDQSAGTPASREHTGVYHALLPDGSSRIFHVSPLPAGEMSIEDSLTLFRRILDSAKEAPA